MVPFDDVTMSSPIITACLFWGNSFFPFFHFVLFISFQISYHHHHHHYHHRHYYYHYYYHYSYSVRVGEIWVCSKICKVFMGSSPIWVYLPCRGLDIATKFITSIGGSLRIDGQARKRRNPNALRCDWDEYRINTRPMIWTIIILHCSLNVLLYLIKPVYCVETWCKFICHCYFDLWVLESVSCYPQSSDLGQGASWHPLKMSETPQPAQ